MRPVVAAGLVSLAFAWVLAGCGPDNSLGGSVSELVDLSISRTEVLRNPDAFQVSYYRNRDREVDLVARVTVAIQYEELTAGGRVPLAGESKPGLTRTTVIHLSGGEPTRVFPAVKEGDLRLDEGGRPGEETAGDFSLVFEESDGFGGGRNLFGTFRAVAQDAGF